MGQNKAKNIAALVDKDYDEILSRLNSHLHLVYTDKNDLEMTLLHCPSDGFETAIERILKESIDPIKRKIFEANIGHSIVEHIRQMASNYGVLRLINEELEGRVKFKSNKPIQPKKFVKDLVFDVFGLNNFFVCEVNKSDGVTLNASDLLERIKLHRNNSLFDGWGLVQGHDFMQLLATAINSPILNKSGCSPTGEESLARDLCLMIHKNDLQTTEMFQNLEQPGIAAGLTFFK